MTDEKSLADAAAYEYTLRCALLFDLKHNPVAARSVPTNRYSTVGVLRRHSRLMSGLNNPFKAPEKYVEIPKALLKGLEQRIQQILMGNASSAALPAGPRMPVSPTGSNTLPVRRRSSKAPTAASVLGPDLSKNCLAKFLADVNVKAFRENLALNGKVDDLLRLYSQIVKRVYRQHWKSQRSLPSTPMTPSDQIENHLALPSPGGSEGGSHSLLAETAERSQDDRDKEMGSFVNARLEKELTDFIAIVRMTVSATCPDHPSTPAILERLTDVTDLHLFDVPETADARLYRKLGPLANRVIAVFQIPPATHQSFVNASLSLCTEENAAADLRLLLDLLNQDLVYGVPRADFLSSEDRRRYADQENLAISQLLEGLRYRNYQYSTVRKTAFDAGRRNDFVFVPSCPRSCYRELLARCLFGDITVAFERPEPPAETPVLTEASHLLLRECTKFWRIPPQAHEVIRLNIVMRMVFCREIPDHYLHEVLHDLGRAYENPKNVWTVTDFTECEQAFTEMIQWVADDFSATVLHLEPTDRDQFGMAYGLLNALRDNSVFLKIHGTNLADVHTTLVKSIRTAATHRYEKLYSAEQAQLPGSGDAKRSLDAEALGRLVYALHKESRQLERMVPPIHITPEHIVNPAGITLATGADCIKLEVHNVLTHPSNADAEIDLGRALDVYAELHEFHSRTVELTGETPLRDELPLWLGMNLRLWMARLETEMPALVASAMRQETTEYQDERFPFSTSVLDVSELIIQQIELLRTISWPDLATETEILKRFAKIILDTLNRYREAVEAKFMATLALITMGDPRTFADRSSMFLRGMGVIIAPSTDSAVPVYFSIDSCVALNNLHILEEQATNMYDALRVQEHLSRVSTATSTAQAPSTGKGPAREQDSDHKHHPSSPPPPPQGALTDRYLVSFHIQHSAAVALPMAQPRPYILFSDMDDPYGLTRLARSRPSFLGTNPRWDEHVEFSIPANPMTLLVTVQDKMDGGSKDEIFAYASLPIDPVQISREVTRPHVLALQPKGRLWLRITVDREQDDVQFYFGKVFRMLQLAQGSLARMIVQQMAHYMRECLSLKNLLRPPVATDGGQAAHSLTLANKFRAFLGRSAAGPPEGTSGSNHHSGFDARGSNQDTDDDWAEEVHPCDALLMPLTDYLNTNLAVLFQNLHSGVSQNIVLRIWREILFIFDDLLLPPVQGPFDPTRYLQLAPEQLETVLACLERLKRFFNGDDAGDVDLLDRLQSRHYYELCKTAEFYHLPVEHLHDLYISFQERDQLPEFAARRRAVQRRKSVYTYGNRQGQRRLGRESKMTLNDTEIVRRLLRLHGERFADDSEGEEEAEASRKVSQTVGHSTGVRDSAGPPAHAAGPQTSSVARRTRGPVGRLNRRSVVSGAFEPPSSSSHTSPPTTFLPLSASRTSSHPVHHAPARPSSPFQPPPAPQPPPPSQRTSIFGSLTPKFLPAAGGTPRSQSPLPALSTSSGGSAGMPTGSSGPASSTSLNNGSGAAMAEGWSAVKGVFGRFV
ncbi:hypothetical protein IWQ60_001581 [Tieghemiomyces parasiticus]|uniref:C2 domain-containing protein n=1 Tax=Tieghemiomyces parasiticus TaxID=78921 RepID=A0A9W8E1T1_9FUNG|nr:hypothetical protein IWQ60_001581 [Tieghemiomyces parasiticus]